MSIENALAGLAGDAPPGLEDRVFAGWLTAPSRLGDVYVAVSGGGVQYVRPVEWAHGDPERFAESYRDRFGRPLRPLARAPRGLRPALRTPAPAVRGTSGADPGSGTEPGGSRPGLDTGALSEFERAVLAATRRIPAGQVRPYGWVAREAGRPAAVRAVGTVLARNPLPLLIPCHRVVRGDGTGEYMFGTERKLALLAEEGLDVDDLERRTGRGERYLASDTTGIVCFPTCHHARRITVAHRRPFRRVDAALAEGFRSCRDCRPAAA